MKNAAARVLDFSAIGLSGFCLAHCLILPVTAAMMPVLGAWAEAEWVHILFVPVAAPLSGLALLRSYHGPRASPGPLALAGTGLLLLAVGAFLAHGETVETLMTVAGSLCLASAHVWNWRRSASTHQCDAQAACREVHRAATGSAAPLRRFSRQAPHPAQPGDPHRQPGAKKPQQPESRGGDQAA